MQRYSLNAFRIYQDEQAFGGEGLLAICDKGTTFHPAKVIAAERAMARSSAF